MCMLCEKEKWKYKYKRESDSEKETEKNHSCKYQWCQLFRYQKARGLDKKELNWSKSMFFCKSFSSIRILLMKKMHTLTNIHEYT